MIRKIMAGVLDEVQNPSLRAYAECYVDIERSFAESVAGLGLPFAEPVAGGNAPDGMAALDATEGDAADGDEELRAERVPEAIGGESASEVVAANTREAESPQFMSERDAVSPLPNELRSYIDNGVEILNDGKSLLRGWRSSACEACNAGIGTETFITSTRCPKRCFFCFNPNQANFDGRDGVVHDVVGQLEERHSQGVRYTHLALTGGEPLLHKDQTVAFFKRARELYPDVHTRLYTSGFGVDEPTLEALRDAGLNEIRFSVKTEDVPWPSAEAEAEGDVPATGSVPQGEAAGEGASAAGSPDAANGPSSCAPMFPPAIEETLAQMALATRYIPDVMVEMPVLPDQLKLMKALLVRLDAIGARGINLLELGYPFFNADEFARRGYLLKPSPYRVLYDYAYAGGLPVQGSERACLELLAFAAQRDLKLGVHYCSMENKHTGEVYLANAPYAEQYPLYALSPQDHFLKTAKVFGADRAPVRQLLTTLRIPFQDDPENDALTLHPGNLSLLASAFPNMEVAIAYALREQREEGPVLRELRVDLTTPATFDVKADL